MNIFLLIVNGVFLMAILFLQWKKTAVLKPLFIPALMMKVVMGILLGVIYTFYYGVGDTLGYVKDGNVIAELALTDFVSYLRFLFQQGSGDMLVGKLVFSEPRAIFLSKVVSIFSLITGGNYWLISIYFSVLSFFGCWYFVRQIHRYIPSITWPAALAFLFFPSIIFWTSGVIKEALAIGSLAFIAALLVKFWFSSTVHWTSWLGAMLAAWLAWNLKYYFAAIFFSVVITTVIYKLVWRKKTPSFAVQCASWLVVFSVLLSISSFLHPNFSPTRFFRIITENYQAYQKLSTPGDAIQFDGMDEPNVSVLVNSPKALFSGLYRPFLWEANDNVFQLWIGFENLIVALLTIVALTSVKQVKNSPHRLLILAIIVYVTILCILLTLSTPNFGTLSRYRTGYLPFFLILLLSTPKINVFIERTLNRLVLYKP